jgi:hypothetical protein
MGTGYIRTDTADNISNGNVIDADDLDTEFNAIETAFNNVTGHTHDGTSSEGAPIEVIGPAQDIVATATLLRPKTTNTIDLGTSSLKYKDAYLAGDLSLGDAATIGGALSVTGAATLSSTLAVTGNTTLTGNLTANGNTTLGNAATDTVTVNADVASNLIPSIDDSYDLGAVDSEWRNAYIDGTAYIDTGSIDTANVATLNVSGNAAVTGTITGDVIGDVTGNADTASTLETARTITLDGDISGAANFDGSSNITITTVIADDSHNHTIANVDGLQAALDAKIENLADLSVTATATELNKLDGVTASTAEINTLDGITASTTELNYMDGVTSNVQTQLNAKPDGLSDLGITATATELNYTDGVTSNIQTQLDTKLSSVDLSSYTGDVDITGELVVDSYNETYAAVTSSSNATTINCEAGNVFSHTLSENTTFTFSNPPSNGTAYVFSLKIVQDASASGYTVTWPSSVDWPDATAPTLTSTASSVDQFVFYTHDNGTTWYGFVAGQDLG